MMNVSTKHALFAVICSLVCIGCESSKPVRELGETTSQIAGNVGLQMEKFAQTQKTLADIRTADIVRLKKVNTEAANDRERQLAVMKLSHMSNQVNFLTNITSIAQAYADKQYAGGQTVAMREAIRLKLTPIDTPATALLGVSKDLNKLSQKADIEQETTKLIQFGQDVKQNVDTLEAAKTNAIKAATPAKNPKQ